jgi:glycosyltransferase involved in cell wall biosynthesis
MRIIKKEMPQIIYSTSPNEGVHLIAYHLKKKMGLPWVSDFRDLWTLYEKRYNPLTTMHHLINKYIERSVYRKWSDAIVANTDENRKIIIKEFGVDPAKIVVITNGYDPSDISQSRDKKDQKNGRRFNIGYIGGLEKPAICYREFLSAFAIAVSQEKNLVLQLWARVSKQLQREINNSMLKDHVVINPYMPHKECMNNLTKVDTLLVLLSDGYQHVVPQKLYNYLGLSKPVLAVVPPEGRSANIIKECNCGTVVDPKKVGNIAEALLSQYERFKANGGPPQINKRALEKYQRDNLTLRLAKLFESTVANTG